MRPPLPAVGLAALLFIAFGCHDELTPPDLREPAQPGPVGFALMEVTITGIGTGNMSASAAPLDSGGALAPSFSLSGPENADASGDGTIELDAVATGSFTDGTRAGGGQRYLYATFRVRNADSDGVAYDSQRENLTFLGVDTDGTHGVTAVSRLFTFGGAEITGADALAIAEAVIPTGQAGQSTGAELMSSGPDVLQVFTEAEVNVGSVPRPAGVNDIFPYGFITRNPDDLTSRTLPASPAADEFDGLVTFAFRLPLQASAAEDPFEISVMVLPMDDSETRITQSVEEQTASARSAMAERADALNAAYATVLPGSGYGGSRRLVCEPVRVAGGAGAASAALFAEPPEFVSLAPDPYAGSGSFVAATPSFAATFDAAAGEPTDSTFVVNGSQSGRRFLGGAYTGGGTATVTSPTGTFFPGEEVEVSLTTGLGGCPPHVARLRIAAGAATGAFGAAASYSTGDSPQSVAIGDLDGDGDLDLATANYGSDNVSAVLGNGDGTFTAAVDYDTGDRPQSVAMGDLDADGDLDLAVANDSDDNVSVLLGDGDGTFAAAANYGVGDSPYSVAISDLDGDGDLDLAVANAWSDDVSVLLGDGDGTFAAAVDYGVGDSPYSVAIGDLDGDGDLDLAVANYFGNDLSVLLGSGNGSFTAPANHAAGNGMRFVAIGDLDGDGELDLAVANENSDNVSVLLGNGDGTFATAVDYPARDRPSSVAIGDLDGDSDLDLAVANFSDNDVSVLLGNGNGTFATAANYAVDPSSSSVAIGDLDGDGRLDLAVTSSSFQNISVLSQP